MKDSEKQRTQRKGILSKFGKKVGRCVLAGVLASAMCLPATALAINGEPTAMNAYGMNPSKEIGTNTVPRTANGDTLYDLEAAHNTTIVAGCGGSGTAIQDYMDVLGANGIGTSGYNWGTKININPNLFAWNDMLYTNDSDVTCTNVGQGADASDASLGIGFVKQGPNGVCTYATVSKYRPQILANNESSTYEKIVAAIQAADGNKNYNPQYVTLDTSGLCTLVDSMWNGAAGIKAVPGYGTTVTSRYGDPEVIAQDFENFIKATQWYILSKHEPNNTMKKLAYVTYYGDGVTVVATVDPTSETTSAGRQYEGFEQITHNIAYAYDDKGVLVRDDAGAATLAPGFQETTYTSQGGGGFGPGGPGGGGTQTGIGTSDISKIAAADVIFTGLSGDSLTAFTDAVKAAGYKGEIISPTIAVGNQGFGFARNLMEYMGYLYPDDFKLAYGLYYFWNKFAHVSAEYVDAVMVDQDATKLLPTGDADTDLNTQGYSEDYMKKIFSAGQNYYKANENNKDSYCSNFRLRAQGTASKEADQANNKYKFDLLDYGKAAKQTVTFKNQTKTVKFAKVKKAKQTVAITKASAKTKVTYSIAKVNKSKKKFAINKNNGKITVKKGLAKGTYKVTVKASAAASAAYEAASKTATITIKVK